MPPLLWPTHPRLDSTFLVRSPGVTLQRVFRGIFLPLYAFENGNPPGKGAILTEVLRIYQILAGRQETFNGSKSEKRDRRKEGRKWRREV